jgi:16S rRNA (guanine1516-N2)-methyltransferase
MNTDKPTTTPLAGVLYTEPDQKGRVEQLAGSLELPIITNSDGYDFVLSYIDGRLNLSTPNDSSNPGKVYIEFIQGAAGFRRKQGRKEMLIKAIGFRKNQSLSVLDTTGGMGTDSFLMAGYGCRVHIIERNQIVAALLQDGLRRASQHIDTCDIAERIHLSVQDSNQLLHSYIDLEKEYDVIYLDPMFPKRNKSALVKKEMQILQKLIGYEDDTDQLFTTALAVAAKRVVVKRPKTATSLAHNKPSHSLSGKSTRFDVYMI